MNVSIHYDIAALSRVPAARCAKAGDPVHFPSARTVQARHRTATVALLGTYEVNERYDIHSVCSLLKCSRKHIKHDHYCACAFAAGCGYYEVSFSSIGSLLCSHCFSLDVVNIVVDLCFWIWLRKLFVYFDFLLLLLLHWNGVRFLWCCSLCIWCGYFVWLFFFFGKFVSIAATLFRIVCFHILFSSCMVFLSSFT